MTFTLPASVPLQRGHPYAWRARAWDGVSWGPYSEVRTFSLAASLAIQQLQTIPNPAVGTNRIQIRLAVTLDSDLTLSFYNQLGQQVDRIEERAAGGTQGNLLAYDISRYASGVYYYVLEARSSAGVQKITRRFAVVK